MLACLFSTYLYLLLLCHLLVFFSFLFWYFFDTITAYLDDWSWSSMSIDRIGKRFKYRVEIRSSKMVELARMLKSISDYFFKIISRKSPIPTDRSGQIHSLWILRYWFIWVLLNKLIGFLILDLNYSVLQGILKFGTFQSN
jgi:hypothetical protein